VEIWSSGGGGGGNRPITYVSADSRDPEALTPFNFLCPGVVVCSTVHVIPPVPSENTVDMREAWRIGIWNLLFIYPWNIGMLRSVRM
jgi:hypothetical protein